MRFNSMMSSGPRVWVRARNPESDVVLVLVMTGFSAPAGKFEILSIAFLMSFNTTSTS